MKKGIKSLLAILIVATACFFAVSCGNTNTHTHTASGDWQNDAEQHWKVCAEDNEKVEVAPHTFGDWVTDKAETCTEKGSKHKECTVCGYKVTEEIAAKGHDYEYTDNGDGTHKGVCKNDPAHVIEKQNHVLGKDFAGHNAEKHWKVCTVCGAKVESAHEFKLDGDTYACACGESMEVTAKDLYKVDSENENERKTFEIDLKVKQTNVLTENQEIGAESYTINIGEAYNGKLLSVVYGRFELDGVTLENGVITLPKDTFSAEDAGEQTILCVIEREDGVYKLTVHLTVATRVISSVEEWNTLLRDPISYNARIKDADDGKSGVYGYYTIASDIDFNHEALRDPAFPAEANVSSFAHKANQVNGKIGFVGTFDGRGYALKNFNTANPFGLFLITDDTNEVKSTVKNLVVDGVWHDNGLVNANIFGHSIAGVTFDNVTINVAKTSLTGTAVQPTDGTLNGRGFICGAYANRNVYKNLTVNASGCTISSLFGWWIKPATDSYSTDEKGKFVAFTDKAKIITCENVTVNAREITYWGRLDSEGYPAMTPAEYPITGLTYNKDEINEIEISNNGKSFIVDLKVADTTKELGAQTVGATGNVTIDLGENYGTLVSVKFNGDEIVGASVNNENQLILPVTAFSAGAIGERTVEVTMQKDKAVNLLSVKVLLATKSISTAAEFKTCITDKTATYGYFVLANDIDFKNTALALPAWYNTANSAARNDNTIYGSSAFFAGTFDGMGHKIKNYNTGSESDGGRYGLFGKIKNATVKNVIFEDVVYTGKEFVSVLAFMAESSKFENITINVKSCAATEKDITAGQYGFIIGRKLQHSSFKDITVNAAGQEIYSLFGYWIMRNPKTNVKDGNYVACENVVVNAKKVHYWGRIDGETLGDATKEAPMDVDNYPINGVTVNVVESAA